MTETALEVWGDPIAHSRSPVLHAAAYRALGLDWSYGRRRVSADRFDAVLGWARDERMRGLSLTFPLKERAFAAADVRGDDAVLTGAVNTLLLGREVRGVNTDVGGLRDALVEAGFDGGPVRIVGAGATARSALVALDRLGAGPVDVVARRPDAARTALAPLAERLSAPEPVFRSFGGDLPAVRLTISTLPGGSDIPSGHTDELAAAGGILYDVVYGHWPTALAAAWQRAGRPAQDGLGMLLHQAVRQVRLFVGGDTERPLDREEAVVAAMRGSLMGD